MQPESMVHALEMIHDLLKPGGDLLDLHPLGIPAEISIRVGAGWQKLGELQETDNFIEYPQAEQAISIVRANGLFQLRANGQYDFLIHAATMDELRGYLAAEWTDAILPPEVLNHPGLPQAEEIILRDFIHIGLLRQS
jgi:hypothetical protein